MAGNQGSRLDNRGYRLDNTGNRQDNQGYRLDMVWIRIAAVPVLWTTFGLLFAEDQSGAAKPAATKTPVLAGPLSPEQALSAFRLEPGYRIELVASEPDVIDPISIAFDEAFSMFVVEMRDYPSGPSAGQPPLSRIRKLRDADGDGRYETAAVFADNLDFVTGLQPWKGGLIVTLAGEIAWMKDTDGDDTADLRESWFKGFAEKNSQLRANHPRFAIDTGVYVANGLIGGRIVATKAWPAAPGEVVIDGFDFRFDPMTGTAEAVSGNGQFGATFDDEGNRFVCSNRNPCRQVMLESRQFQRNPFLVVPDVCVDVSPAAEASRVFPLTRAWTTSNLHAGQFTAACGVHLYRGDRCPDLYGSSFTCEPTGNLVHRDRLMRPSAAYQARPSHDEREFLASTDEWFRPVDLHTGPDGALYVVDMYRAVIEHPDWVPDELKNRPDQRFGDDRGRIWRIVPVRESTLQPRPALATATTSELVAAYEHPNAWVRETAHRLVYERQDADVVPALKKLSRSSRMDQARVLALYALRGLGRLDQETLMTAALSADLFPLAASAVFRILDAMPSDQRPDAAALHELMSRLHQAVGLHPHLGFEMVKLLADSRRTPFDRTNPLDVEQLRLLADWLVRGCDDVWLRRAVMTAAPDRLAEMLNELVSSAGGQSTALESLTTLDPKTRLRLVRELSEVVGAARNPDLESAAFTRLESQAAALNGNDALSVFSLVNVLLDGMAVGAERAGASAPLVLDSNSSAATPAVQRVLKSALAFNRAAVTGDEARLAADPLPIRILGLLARPGEIDASLLKLLRTARTVELRLAAVNSIWRSGAANLAEELLVELASQSPSVKRAIVGVVLRRADWARVLLARISDGEIPATELDPDQIQLLTNHYGDAGVRDEARRVFAALIPADRKEVLARYKGALTLEADATRGKAVFARHCATCHRIDDTGVAVGPDISDSRTKTPEQLYNDILNPNAAIDSNYRNYTAVTRSGVSHSGIIAAETASSVTLKQPEGKTISLLRTEIDELRSTGVSLMPEGIERNITTQELADLISYIKNWRYLDGLTPLGSSR